MITCNSVCAMFIIKFKKKKKTLACATIIVFSKYDFSYDCEIMFENNNSSVVYTVMCNSICATIISVC